MDPAFLTALLAGAFGALVTQVAQVLLAERGYARQREAAEREHLHQLELARRQDARALRDAEAARLRTELVSFVLLAGKAEQAMSHIYPFPFPGESESAAGERRIESAALTEEFGPLMRRIESELVALDLDSSPDDPGMGKSIHTLAISALAYVKLVEQQRVAPGTVDPQVMLTHLETYRSEQDRLLEHIRSHMAALKVPI